MCRDLIDLVDVQSVNVLIGESGHHLWICTEKGTVLRIKANEVFLDDRRSSETTVPQSGRGAEEPCV